MSLSSQPEESENENGASGGGMVYFTEILFLSLVFKINKLQRIKIINFYYYF